MDEHGLRAPVKRGDPRMSERSAPCGPAQPLRSLLDDLLCERSS